MNIQELKQQIFMVLTLALVAVYCWMTFGGARELVYMMVPLAGLLSQIGGTWKKQYRRFGIPSMLTIATIGFIGWSWWWILLWPAYFGLSSLPFTLKGDKLADYWFNWLWVVVLGILAWACAVPYALASNNLTDWYWMLLWTILGFSLPGILSNIKATAKFFEWKLVESLIWGAITIPACYFISWWK